MDLTNLASRAALGSSLRAVMLGFGCNCERKPLFPGFFQLQLAALPLLGTLFSSLPIGRIVPFRDNHLFIGHYWGCRVRLVGLVGWIMVIPVTVMPGAATRELITPNLILPHCYRYYYSAPPSGGHMSP